MEKKVKLKWKNIIIVFIMFILTITLIISIYNIIGWMIDNKKTQSQVDKVNDLVNIDSIDDSDQTEIINQEEEIPKFNPYWDYIKMNLINVDFTDLKKTNNQVKGWIQVNGTNINYPFVKTSDNSYYLTHSLDKSYNIAGWVFMDYRNNVESFDKNTIIYGHGRLDKTMFGSLKGIVKSNWYNDKKNYVIKLSTEYENTLWQVFSVYHIPTTSDYLKTSFNNTTEFKEFIDLINNRTVFDFNTSVSTNDKILTLSTCFNKDEKVVMHAKLIKREKRH